MSGAATSIHIHGVAVTAGWADARLSLTDLIFKGVTAGLADAGASMSQMDSIVLSSHDLVDGRSLASMVTSPAAGAYMRDEIRLTDDGLNALSLAAARIEAGESECAVVAAWGRASEGDYQTVSRAGFDPFMSQPFGLDEMSVSALRLSAWLGRFGAGAQSRADAARLRLARATANPRSLLGATRAAPMTLPLSAEDAPTPADIVVVAILGKAAKGVRITGIGHGTDRPAIGDRDLLDMTALRRAAAIASEAAEVSLDAFDLYELDGATLSDEALALEAIGIAPAGGGFAAYAADDRINPSGGSAAMSSYPTNGLVRLAEACERLRRGGGPRTALVTGLSPIGAQTAVAVALEAC